MKKEFWLDITQADIDAGLKCNGMRCPMALALKRHGWKQPLVSVHVYDEADTEETKYEFGFHGATFVNDFDSGIPVQPTRMLMVEDS